uniref:Prepilin-type N-terminal cleavage/methylation domain-containing protein n=1 Tax=Schlesneria paludicola TaxID=360056 RepID=A0A7C2P5D9_9PLAN
MMKVESGEWLVVSGEGAPPVPSPPSAGERDRVKGPTATVRSNLTRRFGASTNTSLKRKRGNLSRRSRIPSLARRARVAFYAERRGFTLVEMLVAVALVMLLMTLFAQVFQMAGGSVSTQRGLMENDQRARTVQTLLYGDLTKRTFRHAIPFAFNEAVTAVEADLPHRRGYISISENDPFNDTDDVLALTVDAAITKESPDVLSFYGKALALAPASLSTTNQYRYYRTNLNQPETDDGRLDLNQSADAQTAEVVYFLRNGNLYRRVLLIRQQSNSTDDDQPQDDAGQRFFARDFVPPGGSSWTPYPGGFAGASNFWKDFDYSAHPSLRADTSVSPPFVYDGAKFNGSLKTLQVKPDPVAFPPPDKIGYPPNRFGHNTVAPSPTGSPPPPPLFGGQPREYGTGGWWVGRLTMEETSMSSWTYPQLTHPCTGSYSDTSNPMNSAVAWNDANGDHVIDGLNGGSRRGEDLLLSNVHSFDIKVWDDVLNEFVDVGHSLPTGTGVTWNGSAFVQIPVWGDYHINNRLNWLYGPKAATPTSSANRAFDTWYPWQTSQISVDFNQDATLTHEDTNNDGVLTFSGMNVDTDTNGNGTLLDHENGPPFRPRKFWPSDSTAAGGRPRLDRWQANQPYTVGTKVFPPQTATEHYSEPFYYVCVNATDNNMSGDTTSGASWQGSSTRIDGLNFQDNELVWQAVDNRKPLRAIQITLRFLDPSTQQMRTLTIQHSLVE